MKDKKGTTITIAFQTILKKYNCKPDKIGVDKGNEFYNRSMKSFMQKNNIELQSTNYEWKSVFAQKYIRTLNNKISMWLQYQKMHILINQMTVDTTKHHQAIKIKPVDAKSNTYKL